MTFDERVAWLLLGCFIGFVLGYIVRTLREIQDKIDYVDNHICDTLKDEREPPMSNEQDEGGYVRIPIVLDIALFLVVCLTVYGALASQHAANESHENLKKIERSQEQIEVIASCNQMFLSDTISSLNGRTESTVNQAEADIDLQKDLVTLFRTALSETSSEIDFRQAIETYLAAAKNFIKASGIGVDTARRVKFPTVKAFENCVEEE